MKRLEKKFIPEWEPLGNDTVTAPEGPENKATYTDLDEHHLPGYHKGYNVQEKSSNQQHSEYILSGFNYQ
jgi:hypothetical protein